MKHENVAQSAKNEATKDKFIVFCSWKCSGL